MPLYVAMLDGVANSVGVLAVSLQQTNVERSGCVPGAGACVSPVPSFLRSLLSVFRNGCTGLIPTSTVPGFRISTCRHQSSLTVLLTAVLAGGTRLALRFCVCFPDD